MKKSDGKQKKRDRSRSPGSKTSTKHAHSSSPLVLTSSGPESAKAPANVKEDTVDRPSSVADEGLPPSSQTMSSDKPQPVQEQTFADTGACAYRPFEESGLYEQFSEIEEAKMMIGTGPENYQGRRRPIYLTLQAHRNRQRICPIAKLYAL